MNLDLHGMTDEQRDQILLDYVEQALSAEDQAAVAEHVRDCPACQVAVDQLHHYQVHVAPLLQPVDLEPSPELLLKLKASLAQVAAPQPSQASGLTTPDRSTSGLSTDLSAAGKRASRWRTWQLAMRPSRQLALAAAAVMILAISWTIVDQGFLSPTARYNQRPANEIALNEVAPDAPDAPNATPSLAAEKNAGLPTDSAAADAESEEPAPAAGQARLRMVAEAAPGWSDALATAQPLPLIDANRPDQVVTALDLVPKAQAAVWLEPDTLIVAISEDHQAEIIAESDKTLPHLSPVPDRIVETATALRARLEARFPADVAGEILQNLDQPGRIFLIFTFGGT